MPEHGDPKTLGSLGFSSSSDPTPPWGHDDLFRPVQIRVDLAPEIDIAAYLNL